MVEHGNLTWRYDDQDPSSNGISTNEIFDVKARVYNNRQSGPNYYDFIDIPTKIDIINVTDPNSPSPSDFSINGSLANSVFYCDESTGNKTCYSDRDWSSTSYTYIRWSINPLPAGTYNITVSIGNPEDQFIIEREINII